MKRVLTAAALIPIICYVVLWAVPQLFLAVLAAAACLTWREYHAIALQRGAQGAFSWHSLLGYAAGLALLLTPSDPWLILMALALVALTCWMRASDLTETLPRAALLVFGVTYVFGAWRCAIPLRQVNPHWLMYALLVSWTGDIGAYYVGRSFGRHRLAARVSPKKSWEGSIASVVAAVGLAGAYLVYFVGVPVPLAIALTAVANAAGQLGDLAESAIKRGAGVKDSGAILPGHGGFFDRVDSTLFTLPVIYAYVHFAVAG
jgi:phosphatidate cytidylyltransferase